MIKVIKDTYPDIFKHMDETNETLHQVIKANNIGLMALLKDKNIDIDPNDYFCYIADKMRVVSFTSSHNSVLMWAHYSDSFRGVMMKYTITPNKKIFEQLLKVRYEEKNQEASSLEDIVEYIFGYKLDDWKYEKEIRVVIDRADTEKYFMNHELSEVYLGAKFRDNDSAMVKKFKEEMSKYKKVRIYESILDEKSYSINYQEIGLGEI